MSRPSFLPPLDRNSPISCFPMKEDDMTDEKNEETNETEVQRRRNEQMESERRAAEAQKANRREEKGGSAMPDLRVGGLRGSPD